VTESDGSGNETEALQTPMEGAAAEPERSRGLRLVALRTPQGVHDCLLLDLEERLGRWKGAGCDRCFGATTSHERTMSTDAEMGGGDDVAVGRNQGALDCVLQLAARAEELRR
jgi:hypothetical protein